ncbi:hypothetical protein BTVI_97118 [Pitangus sulphuratus]|nr:hypothetical protein BTVI_97118 [Pitangus sulphuratus]
MSLFKARDWWSTVLGEKEEFDQGCLCVADVDNSGTGQDKVIVGSYMGYLRIFNPHPVKPGDEVQPEDLLLEVQLQEPILQVEVGKFVSDQEADQSWQLLKDTFLRAQSSPSQSGKADWIPVWMSKDLLLRLRSEKEMHSQWEQGQVTWGEYRSMVQMCRDGIEKVKALMEQDLARDIKNYKK